MRNKIFAGIALLMLGAVALTGCDKPSKFDTLEERIKNREACEEAGGTYTEEWWLGNYRDWDCKLTQ